MVFEIAAQSRVTALASGETWTGARIADETARRASFFRRLGIGPGDIAAVAHGGTPAFFADLFALWQVGASAACLSPALTVGEIANVVQFVDAAAVLVADGADLSMADVGVRVVAAATDAPAGGDQRGAATPSPDDPALILFTSGTTGTPKGVVHTHRSLGARIELNLRHIGAETLAHTLCVLPTHFGHGLIGNCLTPLAAGGALYLSPESGIATAANLGTILEDHAVTFMSSVPTLWKMALKIGKAPVTQTLKQVHVGSAPLSAELWHDIQDWTGIDNVVNMYGITETANWLAGASAAEFAPEDGLIGRMWGGLAEVVDEDGEAREAGEGQLIVQTPALMRGYLHRDDLTGEVVRDGWFYTGDIGHIDDDGIMRLTGRQKSEINKAGMKVHPEEIDLLLERHPDVAEACAFGVPDDVSGELVGVAVRLAEGARPATADLQSWCAERIKRDCVPDKIYFVAEIPKTDRGKVNRETVRAACAGEAAKK